MSLIARLASGARREQATALVRQVVANTLPDSAARVGMARTAYVLGMNEPSPGNDSTELVIAFTAMASIGILILLVGWMNVSSLMVAAAVARRHEIAVRLSLGASRLRLVRQLVTESTLLAVAGSSIGLTLAWSMLSWSQKTDTEGLTIVPDVSTFAVVAAMAVVTGILFGLSPALHATRGGISNALRDSSTGASSEAVDSLSPRITERPEVLGVVPEAAAYQIRRVVAPDRSVPNAVNDSAPTIVHVEGAAPGWFALLDVPIVLGRDVSLADTAAADRPAVIGTDLARSLWGAANPIGRSLASPAVPGLDQDSIAMTVVGVYDATRRLPGMIWGGQATRPDATARVYTAHGKNRQHDRLLVRTRGPAAAYLPDLQRFVRARAPSLPVSSIMTLEQVDARAYRSALQVAGLAGAGGALALLLASLGLYGVISLAVRQRTREIGVRIAIGARPMEVARMFLASGVRASLVALALGLPLSIAALRIGMSQGVVIAPKVNPYLIGVVIAPVLLAVASAATWVPARRAALVDPARTLRVE